MSSGYPILVSACLLGVNCRYDGTNTYHQGVIDYLTNNNLQPIPVCPEQLGGLSTPRSKAWFVRGDGDDFLQGKAQLTDETGQNPTELFLRGAEETVRIAHLCRCKTAILKQRSPSCGSRQIHRNGQLVKGTGITCALLQQQGFKILSEEDLY
ncbi:DUF523 domain-containing protein [Geopsychrobacter electrodiphilus]|uniref:DUF523 domain-containing protein n=1 Tax=Geopsychrobacter electrodiphilus TaxID=225196 RepID=UPI00037CE957|nr:DUF523 domain-containing protein [Geopsychrobacter electrodiphilus]